MNIKKLSTAILRGTKLTKRGEGNLYEAKTKGFCALGAAAFAMGAVDCTEEAWEKNGKLSKSLRRHFNKAMGSIIEITDLSKQERKDFEGHIYLSTVLSEFIVIANDELGWRRDKIGRFVARLGF